MGDRDISKPILKTTIENSRMIGGHMRDYQGYTDTGPDLKPKSEPKLEQTPQSDSGLTMPLIQPRRDELDAKREQGIRIRQDSNSDKASKIDEIKSKIKEHNTEQDKWYHFSPLTAPRPEENANKLAAQVYNETKDSDADIGKTIKLMDKYRYDNLWPGRIIGGPALSHVQWWIGAFFMSFFKIGSFIMFVIIVIFAFVLFGVVIGVINMGLEGVHGTLKFVSTLMGGLNKIAMGGLTGPKRKVDAQNKKIPKNAIELFILFAVKLIMNPMPLLEQLRTIIMGITKSL